MSSSTLEPRLIIHGGAGNITRKNLHPKAWELYRSTLLDIHRSTSALLFNGATALDAATCAVAKFEDCPLFNCGKGAVFTRDGTIELEASVMVTRGFNKRACAVVLVNRVKNPIRLAREMLVRGEEDGSGEDVRGAQGHCCLGGETVERLAEDWGLEMVDESYFWTRKRWDEHKRGLYESGNDRTLRQNVDVRPDSADLFLFLVGLAILQAPGCRATVSEITEWLSSKVAWLAEPQNILHSRVYTELIGEAGPHCTLDQFLGRGRYFVEQRPQENPLCGPEPYWTIASEKVALFVEARDEGWWSYGLHNKIEERQNDKSRWPLFPEQDSGWDGQAYLPQGTVGCVALDKYGTMCVATSTGGLTNKLSGRIGDTPTIGAGFWAEEWNELSHENRTRQPQNLPPTPIPAALSGFADGLRNVLGDCIPKIPGYHQLPSMQELGLEKVEHLNTIRAVAMSGTGNGDSFLRLSAARTAGAIVRFCPNRSLASAVRQVAGAGGELQRSAGERWGKTGEGEGGIIGIELVDGKGKIVFDFNCGGMFRCWVDDCGEEKVMVFKDEY